MGGLVFGLLLFLREEGLAAVPLGQEQRGLQEPVWAAVSEVLLVACSAG